MLATGRQIESTNTWPNPFMTTSDSIVRCPPSVARDWSRGGCGPVVRVPGLCSRPPSSAPDVPALAAVVGAEVVGRRGVGSDRDVYGAAQRGHTPRIALPNGAAGPQRPLVERRMEHDPQDSDRTAGRRHHGGHAVKRPATSVKTAGKAPPIWRGLRTPIKPGRGPFLAGRARRESNPQPSDP